VLAPRGRRLIADGGSRSTARRPASARWSATAIWSRSTAGSSPPRTSRGGLHRAAQAGRHRVHDRAPRPRQHRRPRRPPRAGVPDRPPRQGVSDGLILLTNDGDIVNEVLRVEHDHEKEYAVAVDRNLTDEFLAHMARGVRIDAGLTRPCKIWSIGARVFGIVLTQGLNRQIRKMCEVLGYQVRRAQAHPHHAHRARPPEGRALAQPDRGRGRRPDPRRAARRHGPGAGAAPWRGRAAPREPTSRGRPPSAPTAKPKPKPIPFGQPGGVGGPPLDRRGSVGGGGGRGGRPGPRRGR
jgi:hypothetical protein